MFSRSTEEQSRCGCIGVVGEAAARVHDDERDVHASS